MTRLRDMEAIAGVALEVIRTTTDRLGLALGRDPSLGEVTEGLAIAFGAARRALSASGAGTADMAALDDFVALAAEDARQSMQVLQGGGR